jgi:hypothetical protein
MLLALVASQLLAFQLAVFDAPSAEPAAGERKLADDTPPSSPPLPDRPTRGDAPSGSVPPDAPPAEAAPPSSAPALPPPRAIGLRDSVTQRSLLSAEPLAGGAALLAQAGWSSLGLLYAQGITRTDDLGALFDLDWAKTELRLGAFYRRPLGPAGPWEMAGRLAVSWYANFGGEWVYDDNHRDRGFEVSPGLSLSTHVAGGILSAIGEAPITVTVRRGGGLLFGPRVSLAYEAPLYGEYTVGARAGVGWRGGSGDAPLSDGRAELQFLLVGGWRVF